MHRLILILTSILFIFPVQVFGGIDFDGEDYFSAGDVTAADGLSSAWFWYLVDLDALGGNLMGKDGAYENYLGATGEAGVCISAGPTSCYQSDASELSTSAGVQSVIIQWGGGNTFSFYIDSTTASGSTQTFSNGTPTTITNSANALILGAFETSSNWMNGQVYHWSMGSGTLTATQIESIMNSKQKGILQQLGLAPIFEVWADTGEDGSEFNGDTFVDRGSSGATWTGTDANSDGGWVAEKTLSYP